LTEIVLGARLASFEKLKKFSLHMKPLFDKGFVEGKPLQKIMVDGGAGVNVMPVATFDKLGFKESESVHRLTYVSARLPKEQKDMLCCMVKEFSDCFTWSYTEMLRLKRELVEHKLPIKRGFRPYKLPAINYNPMLYDRIKEEVERLLEAGII
jgi:hypothetical protein